MPPTHLATLPIGHSLGQGRYHVLKKLGKGSYGSVYVVRDTRLGGRQMAIKELLDPSPESRALFEHEAMLLANLNHPSLVHVSDFFAEGRSLYLVMDYIEGRDLREVIRDAEAARQHVPIEQVLDWIIHVCEGVTYLHRRTPPIVHRDIKPANIRLNAEGRAILVDFGISKVDPKAATIVMAKAVSAGFSPPEQYEGGGGTDTRSDVYALGATLYCLLTLKVPPDGFERYLRHTPVVPPTRFNPAISTALEEIILKATALESVDRYDDAEQLLKALRASTRPLIVPAGPPPLSAPVPTGVKCWRCSNMCRPGARYCPKCGAVVGTSSTPVSSVSRCPACGSPYRPAARFCNRCGATLDSGRATPPLADSNPHVALGNQYAQAGQWAQAVDEYEQAMQAGRNDPELYLNLGQAYTQLDRSDDAIKTLEEAVRQHPRNSAVHVQLAQAYLDAGRTVPAIQMLQRAYQLTPDDEALGLQLAKTCFYADQLTHAEQVLLDVQRKNPQQPECSFWLGMIEMKRGQVDYALKHFRRVVQQSPEHAMAYYFIGDLLAGQKNWAEALAAYQRCAEVNPADADPLVKQAQCYLALKQPSEAAEAVRAAQRIDPDNELARSVAAQLPGNL
jgi:tetratricopeptide (TPR) repeat protein